MSEAQDLRPFLASAHKATRDQLVNLCSHADAEINDLRQRVRELEAARPEWQPIETAPKSGAFLAWADGCGHDVLRRTATGFQCLRGFPGGWATHWMPLPQPPNQ